MKKIITILIIIAFGLIVYNLTILDFSDLTAKENSVALICIIACICAILLLLILNTSKRIEKKLKEK